MLQHVSRCKPTSRSLRIEISLCLIGGVNGPVETRTIAFGFPSALGLTVLQRSDVFSKRRLNASYRFFETLVAHQSVHES